ncbi:uncharacterized protein LOC103313212 isoform X1 [Tribolium castaneum]|uniref:uncharacterized protein LOC103313212 isoform X1 n=1 Tax=Tribolium castaneum TaxID=7070 RepID=UPI00046C27E4|nr:PREDICTED: uncharacterized protein LOC103313212 [Tribolium castaneum]|eukprot:XP_008194155.1 PREDICTED: uncharacterized protein LOC103313212 [Tribolium castaneum]
MFVFLWLLLWVGFRRAEAYIETVFVSGCESCKLYLTCRHLSSIIAVLEADFTPDYNTTALVPTYFPPVHPRQALNKRCSGVNHCSFILTEDCPDAHLWGTGRLRVKYVCISENEIRKFCNSEILLSGPSEGFIHNPGYPRFYSSQRQCRWKLRAPREQRIRVTVLDISITADRITHPDECSDRLEILDSGQLVQTTCKPQDPPLEVVSESEFVEVVLVSAHSLVPLRGVLIHYTAVGCPTPDAPEDGYLVYRNETAAEYRCCINRAFEDDGQKTKIINCEGAKWDVDLPLPNCTKKLQQKPLLTVQDIGKSKNIEMVSDVLAPALLIAALFLINFMVLFYIYKIKQKHAEEFADEELGTLPLSSCEKASP